MARQVVEILVCRHHIEFAGGAFRVVITRVVDMCASLFRIFRFDDDDAVAAPRAVDRRGRCVFQYVERGDILCVDRLQVVHRAVNPVDDDKGRASGADRPYAAELYFGSRIGIRTRRIADRQAGDFAADQVDGAGRNATVEIGSVDPGDGTRKFFLADGAVTDGYDLFDCNCALFHPDVQRRACDGGLCRLHADE